MSASSSTLSRSPTSTPSTNLFKIPHLAIYFEEEKSRKKWKLEDHQTFCNANAKAALAFIDNLKQKEIVNVIACGEAGIDFPDYFGQGRVKSLEEYPFWIPLADCSTLKATDAKETKGMEEDKDETDDVQCVFLDDFTFISKRKKGTNLFHLKVFKGKEPYYQAHLLHKPTSFVEPSDLTFIFKMTHWAINSAGLSQEKGLLNHGTHSAQKFLLAELEMINRSKSHLGTALALRRECKECKTMAEYAQRVAGIKATFSLDEKSASESRSLGDLLTDKFDTELRRGGGFAQLDKMSDELTLSDKLCLKIINNREKIQNEHRSKLTAKKLSEGQKLLTLKDQIIPLMNDYINPYLLSIFGHHHDDRATAVRNAISQAKDISIIVEILLNQKMLFETGRGTEGNIPETLLSARFTTGLVNRPPYPEKSGFYRALIGAIQEVDKVAPHLVPADLGLYNALALYEAKSIFSCF